MKIEVGFFRDDNDTGVVYEIIIPEEVRRQTDALDAAMDALQSNVSYSMEAFARVLGKLTGNGKTSLPVKRREVPSDGNTTF